MELTLTVITLCSAAHLLAAFYGMFLLGKYEDVFTGIHKSLVLDTIHLVMFINFIVNVSFLYKFDTYLLSPCYCIGFSLFSFACVLYYFIADKYLNRLKKTETVEGR